jgi:RNA polymerase-binding transcription factor
MDKKTREKFKKLLLNEKAKIIGEIRTLASENLNSSQRDSSGDLSGYSLHMADVGSDNFQREFALDLVSNEQKIVYQIDSALKSIDEGTYGNCEHCDKVISEARLKAVPFAKLCITCKEKEESEEE